MEIVGYLIAILIGLSLGLIGGGGSILTVPVLVYLFKIDAVLATSYSLFIVGITSLVGVWPKFKNGDVNFKVGLVFGIPSIASIYLTRVWILPIIPEWIINNPDIQLSKSTFLLLIFSVLMFYAAFKMIFHTTPNTNNNNPTKIAIVPMILQGLMIGLLAGLVGAGGGFLIIPALVLWGKLPIKNAIGTSLFIIATNSIIGFIGDLGHQSINWHFLLLLTTLAILGIFIGTALSKKLDGSKLKKGFGFFVLAMGIFIILKELIL